MNTWEIFEGDCTFVMRDMRSNSIDAIVTDPPAGISFMGNDWDSNRGGRDNWILWMSQVAKECLRLIKPGGYAFVWALPRTSHWTAAAWENSGFDVRDCVYHLFGQGFPQGKNSLKPAVENWWLFRKPISEKTVSSNVAKHGTGDLNIDDCKVGESERCPANLIHDGSDEVTKLFPKQKSGGMKKGTLRAAQDGPNSVCYGVYGGDATTKDIIASEGSASRFFYAAKPKSKHDRGENNTHPTVKSLPLMKYLCRLVTPKNGTILDPFCGSGTTGIAAISEKFNFIGIELNPEYVDLAAERIENG